MLTSHIHLGTLFSDMLTGKDPPTFKTTVLGNNTTERYLAFGATVLKLPSAVFSAEV